MLSSKAARLGKAAAGPAGLAALGAASAPTAHADASASSSDVVAVRRIQDWELVDGAVDKVLFKPDDIDDALVALAAQCQTKNSELVGGDDAASSVSSPRVQLPAEDAIDAVIERTAASSWSRADNDSAGALLTLPPLSFDEVSTVASRLLKQPAVQRELVAAALADPEVFAILASKLEGDALPAYLASAGFAARGLLMGGGGGTAAATDTSNDGGLMCAALDALGEAVEGLGDAVARLGRWLRAQLRLPPGPHEPALTMGAGGRAGVTGSNGADALLGAAMVVCVAVIAVVLLRRPTVLRQLLRRAGRARA